MSATATRVGGTAHESPQRLVPLVSVPVPVVPVAVAACNCDCVPQRLCL